MKSALIFRASLVALLLVALPVPSFAQVVLNFNVGDPPPPIPTYYQPQVPQQNDIWTPGYWAWGQGGYFWVPGTWVQAPQPGLAWTPGYWGWTGNGFGWNSGYWSNQVGYYGGVNYGNGYYGNGYNGGGWQNNVYRYNTYVTNVNPEIVRYVYVDRTVYVNNGPYYRTSYWGGRGGLRNEPTREQREWWEHNHRYPMTYVQTHHVYIASQNRYYLASVNHGRPPVLAVARPLTVHPKTFAPITAADRTVAQEHVYKSSAHTEALKTNTAPLEPKAMAPYKNPAPKLEPVKPAAPKLEPVKTAAPEIKHYAAPVPHVAAPVEHVITPKAYVAPPVTHVAAPVYHAPPKPVVHAPPATVHTAPKEPSGKPPADNKPPAGGKPPRP